jgi:hypothetical protein
MSPEEIELILNRPGGATTEPTLLAVIAFVESMTSIAVAEACGFHTASVLNVRRDVARAEFVNAMEKAAQDTGP